jgi:hypothetical protein
MSNLSRAVGSSFPNPHPLTRCVTLATSDWTSHNSNSSSCGLTQKNAQQRNKAHLHLVLRLAIRTCPIWSAVKPRVFAIESPTKNQTRLASCWCPALLLLTTQHKHLPCLFVEPVPYYIYLLAVHLLHTYPAFEFNKRKKCFSTVIMRRS